MPLLQISAAWSQNAIVESCQKSIFSLYIGGDNGQGDSDECENEDCGE